MTRRWVEKSLKELEATNVADTDADYLRQLGADVRAAMAGMPLPDVAGIVVRLDQRTGTTERCKCPDSQDPDHLVATYNAPLHKGWLSQEMKDNIKIKNKNFGYGKGSMHGHVSAIHDYAFRY